MQRCINNQWIWYKTNCLEDINTTVTNTDSGNIESEELPVDLPHPHGYARYNYKVEEF